jgi:hypothetical protein
MRPRRLAAALLVVLPSLGCAQVAGVDHDYELFSGCAESCADAMKQDVYPCDADAAKLFDPVTSCARGVCYAQCGPESFLTDNCQTCLSGMCAGAVDACKAH